MSPNRVHLAAPANPIGPDLARFGFPDVGAYIEFAQRQLPGPLRLTCSRRLLEAIENPRHGGRMDDAARVRDLQGALEDPRTLAIVAASGGAYLSRILPAIDFDVLGRRRTPLWALGFSELSPLIGQIAGYRCGRGLYWLCPNWMAYRLKPPDVARAALAEFWRILPALLAGGVPSRTEHLHFGPLRGTLVHGRITQPRVRIVGGCLAVLAAVVGGRIGRRMRPDGRWLLLEDIREAPYRLDRQLSALKHAGWFERVTGLLIGDFRMLHEDTQPAVLELLRYHLPSGRRVPIVVTREVGHVWPMTPLLLNRRLPIEVRGREVTIWSLGKRG